MKSSRDFKNEYKNKDFNELSNLLLNENISEKILQDLQEDKVELPEIVKAKIVAKRMQIIAEVLSKKKIILTSEGTPENIINNMVTLFHVEQFSKEAKKFQKEEKLLDYCVKTKAWNDAIQYVRKIDSNVCKYKNDITDFLIDELKNNQDIICHFDDWHEKIRNNKNEKIKSSWDMNTGLWQKLINMSFKYLYCVKDKFTKFDDIWDKCHCPIDSIILDRLYNILKEEPLLYDKDSREFKCVKKHAHGEGNNNWNNLDDEKYGVIQTVISKVCEENKITPLKFDFLYW